MQYTYEYHGLEYVVTLEIQPDGTYRAQIGDSEYTVMLTSVADGVLTLQVDGEKHLTYASQFGNKRSVQLDGIQYELTVPERTGRRASSQGHTGDLISQMPGQVVSVLVQEGDEVTEGQTLFVLEAMKMEIRIPAQKAGVVNKIHVREGDVIERGQLLGEVD